MLQESDIPKTQMNEWHDTRKICVPTMRKMELLLCLVFVIHVSNIPGLTNNNENVRGMINYAILFCTYITVKKHRLSKRKMHILLKLKPI